MFFPEHIFPPGMTYQHDFRQELSVYYDIRVKKPGCGSLEMSNLAQIYSLKY